ncbi:MAG: MFS transporter [Anaerolineae bacterium]|nr:MAG: MFS transporter [Anaerolineae bacterium]
MRPLTSKRGLHYGWIVLAVSTLTVMGCLGFARFGYTMILPSMQAALGLTNTQTGVLATGNFVGYLIMGTIGGFVASHYGPRRVIVFFMLLTGLTMLLTGLAGGFVGAVAWRVLTGVGSGGSNVPVMALLSSWFAARRRGLASGIAVGGSSLALIAIGFLVPRILNAYGGDGWRYSWFALGAGVLLLGILGLVLLRERPEEKGLLPIGAQAPAQAEQPVLTKDPTLQQDAIRDWRRVYRSGSLWHLALVYVAFGFSYVIYATFFAKYLQAEAGYTQEAAGNLWTVVGWISILCGLIWGSVSDAIGRQYGLALVYALQATSFAVFALWRAPSGYVLSAALFGLTAWSIPGIVAAACGDCVGARLAPAAFGFVTLFFGLGQAIGPSVAGALADRMDSFRPAFLLAAGVALIGGVGSLFLRPQCEIAI